MDSGKRMGTLLDQTLEWSRGCYRARLRVRAKQSRVLALHLVSDLGQVALSLGPQFLHPYCLVRTKLNSTWEVLVSGALVEIAAITKFSRKGPSSPQTTHKMFF